jgi:hypothetical protein
MPTPAEMAAVFERIRAAVLQEATRPSPYDAEQHAKNQAAFTETLRKLCDRARLRVDMTADDLWEHVWTKIRYAGFRASFVDSEIQRLKPFFADFRVLVVAEWQFDPNGNAHGKAVQEFLSKSGRFEGISLNKNARKLRLTLSAAASFRSFPACTPALTALFGDNYHEPGDDALWQMHARLAELVGDTTALHVMMDIGFTCVKPDIWLVRLMCRLGWIEDVLPAASPDSAIKKNYQKRAVAQAVITCARQIAEVMTAWCPKAPLREFDFVMVKYGQRPGKCGITRSLHDDWLPVQRIMQWHPPNGQT